MLVKSLIEQYNLKYLSMKGQFSGKTMFSSKMPASWKHYNIILDLQFIQWLTYQNIAHPMSNN